MSLNKISDVCKISNLLSKVNFSMACESQCERNWRAKTNVGKTSTVAPTSDDVDEWEPSQTGRLEPHDRGKQETIKITHHIWTSNPKAKNMDLFCFLSVWFFCKMMPSSIVHPLGRPRAAFKANSLTMIGSQVVSRIGSVTTKTNLHIATKKQQRKNKNKIQA